MMRKLFKIGITLTVSSLMLIATSVIALAADKVDNKGEIVVHGNGIVTVDPDLATLYISIDTNAVTAEKSQTDNAEISARVIAAMKEMGIKDEDIKTNSYRVNPRYNYDNETNDKKLMGYDVSNNLFILTADVKNTGKYLDAAVKAGATGNDGVVFSMKDPTKYYGDALSLAIANAKKSAETIAGVLGVPLGKPVLVTENYSNSSYAKQEAASYGGLRSAMPTAVADTANSADIRYDKIQISADVNITFQYE